MTLQRIGTEHPGPSLRMPSAIVKSIGQKGIIISVAYVPVPYLDYPQGVRSTYRGDANRTKGGLTPQVYQRMN